MSCFDLRCPIDTLCYGFTKAGAHSQPAFDGYRVFFPRNSTHQHISRLKSIGRSSQFFICHEALFPGPKLVEHVQQSTKTFSDPVWPF